MSRCHSCVCLPRYDFPIQVINQKALTDVSERLRDTKRSVRRDAAMHLMAVFRCVSLCLRLGTWMGSHPCCRLRSTV